jgi:hypothetical protein
VGKRKRVDVYLEVRKRRGHIFLNETIACAFSVILNFSNGSNISLLTNNVSDI